MYQNIYFFKVLKMDAIRAILFLILHLLTLNQICFIESAYTISITGPEYAVHGAKNIEFICSIMSSTNEIPIWYFNDNRLDTSGNSGFQSFVERSGQAINSRLILFKATLDKVGTYKCHHDANKVLKFHVVRFDSPNDVLMKFKPNLNEYQDVTLDCKTGTQDNVGKSLVFKWKFNGHDINPADSKKYVVGKDFLTVLHPNETDCGNYVCQSSQLPNVYNTVVLKGTVRVLPLNEIGSVSLVEGDTLKLKCNAVGCPKPIITWYRNRSEKGKERLDAIDRVSFTKDSINDLENSTLKIKDMSYDDKGVYTCVASNGITTGNDTITVRVKDKLAALWPFLGICIEVAILCTIILIYERRRAKKHAQAESAKASPNYKSPDVVEVSEDQDLRHRKP